MKPPTKPKIFFSTLLSGFFLGCSVCLRPYDWGNFVVAFISVMILAGAAHDFKRYF